MSASGVMKGAATYMKFHVRGEPLEPFHDKAMARIRTRMFQHLAPEDDAAVSVGWVPVERPYDEEIAFRSDGVFFGSYLNLALRIDRWKFPNALVRSKMNAAEREWKNKTGKSRLSKAEKTELRDLVERKLRRDGVPTIKVADFTWDTSKGVVRFFGKSKATLEFFHELFEKTFSVKLVPATAYTLGALVVSKDLVETLTTVEHTALHTQSTPSASPASTSPAATTAPPGSSQDQGPSLGELIETRRFLGREFLAWMWFESKLFEEQFAVDPFGRCEIRFENSITLETQAGNYQKEKSALSGFDPSDTPEAREALCQGKLPTKAKISVVRGEQTFVFVFDADAMSFSSMKIPALLRGEGDDPFYDRIALIEEIESAIETLYGTFLGFRLGKLWASTFAPAIHEWMWDKNGAALAHYQGLRGAQGMR
jgi:hypothetical protein